LHYNSQPVGTVILYFTGKVVGIHSLGVLPKMRGNGIARKTMELLINLASKQGMKQACLQASDSANPMYKKLGFREQFKMLNYQIINT